MTHVCSASWREQHLHQRLCATADTVQRDFQPFSGDKGLRKALLRQELALVQVLVSGSRVMVEQKQLFDLCLLGQVYHVFPGTMPPALLPVSELIPTVLGIMDQDIDPAHRLQHAGRELLKGMFVVSDIGDPRLFELEHIP